MELCSMICGSLDEREVWGRLETCICMAEFLHCSPETITALLIGSTPTENKKIKLQKKKSLKSEDLSLAFSYCFLDVFFSCLLSYTVQHLSSLPVQFCVFLCFCACFLL